MNRLPSVRPHLLVVLVAALLLFPGVLAAADAPWPIFRGPHGTGVAAEGLPAGDGPLGLDLAWKRPLGSGYSAISVAEGLLVTAFQAGERDVVAAFDPASGDERWRIDLSKTHVGHDGSHDGPMATPAIAAGRVFMVGGWGDVVALETRTGREIWRIDLVEDLGCEPPYYGFASSPALIGERVVLQVGGPEAAVVALAAATGELLWRTEVGGEVGAQSPIVAELAGKLQILTMGTSEAVGLDASDGSILWRYEHGGGESGTGAYTSSPLPVGGDRLLLKHDGEASAVVTVTAPEGSSSEGGSGGGLGVAHLADSRAMSRSYSPATVAEGTVYGYTARFLSAVDPATGDLLWRSREVGDGFVIMIDGHLLVLEKTGGLHLGVVTPEGWSEVTTLDLFADDLAWTPPSYADGAVYARSLGEIARIDVVRGPVTRLASARRQEMPALLTGLAATVGAADEPAGVVDDFLAGRDLPLVDGEDVVFLWRGEAEDVAVAGDMIGMRREEPMRRLEGTDLWWWHTRLDRRAHISYRFYVDYQATLDPAHDRTVVSTVLGSDMNWNRGEPAEMSWFAMPEWPGSASAIGGAVTPEAGGRLETFEVTLERTAPEGEEALEPLPLPLEVWVPPGYDEGDERYPVVFVHHAAAREPGRWVESLDAGVGRSFAPVIVVFVDYPRAPGLSGTFVGQVVPAIDGHYRTLDERGARANVGMGWPGFSAARLTFSHPETFGVLGVQSLYLLEEQMGMLEAAIDEGGAARQPMRIYLEWGRWDLVSPHEEMDFRYSSRWAWDLFEEKGWEPTGGEVWDSTDFASWGNRTGVLLGELFPAEGGESGLDRWLTASR